MRCTLPPALKIRGMLQQCGKTLGRSKSRIRTGSLLDRASSFCSLAGAPGAQLCAKAQGQTNTLTQGMSISRLCVVRQIISQISTTDTTIAVRGSLQGRYIDRSLKKGDQGGANCPSSWGLRLAPVSEPRLCPCVPVPYSCLVEGNES